MTSTLQLYEKSKGARGVTDSQTATQHHSASAKVLAQRTMSQLLGRMPNDDPFAELVMTFRPTLPRLAPNSAASRRTHHGREATDPSDGDAEDSYLREEGGSNFYSGATNDVEAVLRCSRPSFIDPPTSSLLDAVMLGPTSTTADPSKHRFFNDNHEPLSFWGVWFVVAAAVRLKRCVRRKRAVQREIAHVTAHALINEKQRALQAELLQQQQGGQSPDNRRHRRSSSLSRRASGLLPNAEVPTPADNLPTTLMSEVRLSSGAVDRVRKQLLKDEHRSRDQHTPLSPRITPHPPPLPPSLSGSTVKDQPRPSHSRPSPAGTGCDPSVTVIRPTTAATAWSMGSMASAADQSFVGSGALTMRLSCERRLRQQQHASQFWSLGDVLFGSDAPVHRTTTAANDEPPPQTPRHLTAGAVSERPRMGVVETCGLSPAIVPAAAPMTPAGSDTRLATTSNLTTPRDGQPPGRTRSLLASSSALFPSLSFDALPCSASAVAAGGGTDGASGPQLGRIQQLLNWDFSMPALPKCVPPIDRSPPSTRGQEAKHAERNAALVACHLKGSASRRPQVRAGAFLSLEPGGAATTEKESEEGAQPAGSSRTAHAEFRRLLAESTKSFSSEQQQQVRGALTERRRDMHVKKTYVLAQFNKPSTRSPRSIPGDQEHSATRSPLTDQADGKRPNTAASTGSLSSIAGGSAAQRERLDQHMEMHRLRLTFDELQRAREEWFAAFDFQVRQALLLSKKSPLTEAAHLHHAQEGEEGDDDDEAVVGACEALLSTFHHHFHDLTSDHLIPSSFIDVVAQLTFEHLATHEVQFILKNIAIAYRVPYATFRELLEVRHCTFLLPGNYAVF